MNRIKKLAAAITSLSIAATIASCGTPTIGSGSSKAMTVDDYEVNAGIFIYYTMQSYQDAVSLLAEQNGATPTMDEVKKAKIDGQSAEEWIQDSATQYCKDYVTIAKEFEAIGGELPQEDIDEIESLMDTALETEIFDNNGIGEESLRQIAESSYKSEYIFQYYYGFEGEKGMDEEALKDYFLENFARVKYVSLSYLDAEGNELDEAGKKEIRELAEDYAERVNSKSGDMNKMFEMDEVQTDYSEYVAEQTAELSTDTATTTTTTTTTTSDVTQTTTTTTTNPYANESIMQKQTTAVADLEEEDPAVTTTTAEPTASEKSAEKLNNFVFEELTEYNKAVVFDDEENDAIYVVIRGDLTERMNEDDLWTEDSILYLQSLNFNEIFIEYMQELSDSYTVEKNESAYRRYEPFEIQLEE